MQPMDFQEATAARILQIFRDEGQNRILLADEVGLGKTIIARTVVQKVSNWHSAWDDHFKVVYICSNINIANQNYRKLGIPDEDCLNFSESRLSMQHLRIYESAGKGHSYQQLIPMTPATSFSMTGGYGIQNERALILVVLSYYPAFQTCRHALNRLMKIDDTLLRWDDLVMEYQQRVEACDADCGNYLSDMMAALHAVFQEKPELLKQILNFCAQRDVMAVPFIERRDVVNALRRIFAGISLDLLKPDLVIMDEFQRFKDLLSGDESESGMLARRFLVESDVKVLLLSATPYKPYSTLEELSQNAEGHYQEFMQVMDFLFSRPEQQSQFREVWRDYSSHLAEIQTDDYAVLITKKNEAEQAMYQCVCRTERLSDAIFDRSKAREMEEISTGDIASYTELQHLMDTLQIGKFPIDYVKSAPYLLSFMNYVVKDKIVRELKKRGDYSEVECSRTMLLRRSWINRYEKIPCNNARLQTLFNEVFNRGRNGAELLLWIPASRPYYQTDNVFSRNAGYSKTLVFSSWEMVPRMIAAMTSYEAERLTVGRLGNHAGASQKKYFAQDAEDGGRRRRKVNVRLRDEMAEVLTYPSRTLASMFDPIRDGGQSLTAVRAAVRKKVYRKLEQLAEIKGLKPARRSAGQVLALLQRLDGDKLCEELQGIPAGAEDLLTDLAIGSPGVCAYRLFRGQTDRDAMAYELANCLISLFNKQESMAVIDVLYSGKDDTDAYYENVARYCVDGNLQAVLDEYAFVLGSNGRGLLDGMEGGFADTASIQVETRESFLGNREKSRLRTHFAVGYFNAQVNEKTMQRTENIRMAFNSPFRPFVLATTSIGQEGLDFHTYCRKIVHWNLPANPIDLEQREGRINRFLCHAIRQNLAESMYGKFPFRKEIWSEIIARASAGLKGSESDLIPYWCLPDDFPFTRKIERIVPMYPYSRDKTRYEYLIEVLSIYRLTLGQPRQEELMEAIRKENWDPDQLEKLYINLSPWQKNYHQRS